MRTSSEPAVIGRSGPSRRIDELDGVRGLAMLMVLTWHYFGEIVDQNHGVWSWWIAKITIVGRTGVDLFFVLSGVLITGIILDRTCAPAGFIRSFYLRRSLRIFPPYLALLVAFLFIAGMGFATPRHSTMPLIYFLTLTQTWWMASHGRWGPDEMSVSWSVSIEEHYYLFFPILMLVLPRRAIPWLLGVIVAGSAGFRAWAFFVQNKPALFAYVFPVCRLDGFAMGGLIALMMRSHALVSKFRPCRVLILWIAAVSVLIVEFLVGIALHVNGARHMYSWGHLVLALVFSLLLFAVLLNQGESGVAPLKTRLLRHCGAISYSVYLFHPICLLLVFRLSGEMPHLRSPGDLILVVGALSGTLLISGLLLRPIERRLIEHGRRFIY